jgi:geranylgeranyl reductase family protein
MYDVVVVGGGPVGGRTAELIAKAGHSVAVIEEHQSVGEPVQCAGLVTPRVFDMVDYARPSIVNEISGANIHSPEGQVITLDGGSAKAIVIDRQKFDNLIIRRAVDNGADIICDSKVKRIVRSGRTWEIDTKDNLEGRILIGADGAGSRIRSWLGIGEPEFMLTGIDAEVGGVDLDQNRVNILVGKNVAPNFFAWLIPARGKTRVGLCTRDSEKPLTYYFDRLFREGPSSDILKGYEVVTRSSGRIPIGMLERTTVEGAMLVGDAASQVKATTGGGIYMGLVCAKHCAENAINALEKDDTSEKAMAEYHRAWNGDIGGELRKCLMLHRILSTTADKDMEALFEVFSDEAVLKLINEHGDIDYPSKLAWALLKKEPKLIKFAGKYFRHLMRRV